MSVFFDQLDGEDVVETATNSALRRTFTGGEKWSFCCWYKLNQGATINVARTAMWWGDHTRTRDYWRLDITGGGSSSRNKIRLGRRQNGTETFLTSTTQHSDELWHHAGAIIRGDANVSLYDNGTKSSDTTSMGVFDTNNEIIAIGSEYDSSPANPFAGYVAYAAAWGDDVGDAAMSDLANGVHPLAISPSSLLYFHPLTHNDAADFFIPTTLNVVTTEPAFSGLMPPVGQWDDEAEYPLAIGAAAAGVDVWNLASRSNVILNPGSLAS